MFAPTTNQPVETVEKEALPSLRFAAEDVLSDHAARERRRTDAERASRLGNSYQGKLDIFFQTADGQPKRVQTTVWGAHPEYLSLKAGITLPLRAVLGFDFY